MLTHAPRQLPSWLIFDVGQKMNVQHASLSEIVGPWEQTGFESGLIERCRAAWSKPISTLTNHELATCLQQKIAVEHLIPIARDRIAKQVEDGSEIDDDELRSAADFAANRESADREDRRIRGLDR